MSLLRASIRVALRPRDAIAALILVDEILDEIEDLTELRTRLARKAMAGDLDDSFRRILSLRRGQR